MRSDEDQKTATLSGILAEEIHDTPGKTLAGATSVAPARACPGKLAQHQQSEPPLSPRVPTQPATLEPGLGRHLRGGMQIFVKIINM